MIDRLAHLAKRAEDATDEFAGAVDLCSEAEADYLRAYHLAYAEMDPSMSEARKKSDSDQRAWEQKVTFKRAEWAVERAKAVLRTRLSILSAAQTHYRAVERQT